LRFRRGLLVSLGQLRSGTKHLSIDLDRFEIVLIRILIAGFVVGRRNRSRFRTVGFGLPHVTSAPFAIGLVFRDVFVLGVERATSSSVRCARRSKPAARIAGGDVDRAVLYVALNACS